MNQKLLSSFRLLLGLAIITLGSIGVARAGSSTWKLNPANGAWRNSTNWTPATVPNGPQDTAAFDLSNTTALTTGVTLALNGIVFNEGASSFTISDGAAGVVMTISGTGITNNSEVSQNFVTNSVVSSRSSAVNFTNNATAGSGTIFTNNAANTYSPANTGFYDNATAGSATFINYGQVTSLYSGAATIFYGNSTGGNATFMNYGGSTVFVDTTTAGDAVILNYGTTKDTFDDGSTSFGGSSTAGNAIITNKEAEPNTSFGGLVNFADSASGGNATIINEGGSLIGADGGQVFFILGGDGGNATIINNGAATTGAAGGRTYFSSNSSAGNSTLIANKGLGQYGGGSIVFDINSTGGTSRVEVFGNGKLSLYGADLTIGSLEGDGVVDMSGYSLTVGSNDLSTTFSGRIVGYGSLTKIGKGTLILSGRNLSHGEVVIQQGTLAVNNPEGSGTGAGPVKVDRGTLAGRGTIKGAVTIGGSAGRHAALSPGKGASRPRTLTIQSALRFGSGGIYRCGFNSDVASGDEVVAAGVTIDPATSIELDDSGSSALSAGMVFTIINNTAATAIAGTFSNLADGAIVTIGSNTFQANYEGGDGNDLTLTVLP